MVKRVHLILEHIIQLTQSAFVPHRAIHGSINLAQEIMNKFRCAQHKKAAMM